MTEGPNRTTLRRLRNVIREILEQSDGPPCESCGLPLNTQNPTLFDDFVSGDCPRCGWDEQYDAYCMRKRHEEKNEGIRTLKNVIREAIRPDQTPERLKVGDRVCVYNGGGESPGLEDAEGGEGTIIGLDACGYTVAMDSGGTYEPYSQDVYRL
jgi:hypothetical protein